MYQHRLPLNFIDTTGEHAGVPTGREYEERLVELLSSDLDFHAQDSGYASHNFHSFPAKFPPQLPRKFIAALTEPGDLVLDPMMGSGTTVLEAFLSGRYGLGFDIDPLAVMLSRVKTTSLGAEQVARSGNEIMEQTRYALGQRKDEIERMLQRRWDDDTRQFVDYWFAPETQVELMALIREIERIDEPEIRLFFELAFSSVIITKWGGVSLAIDLAHTRPHRAKVVIDPAGKVLIGSSSDDPSQRDRVLTKRLRSPLGEFEKRYQRNLESLVTVAGDVRPGIVFGNAQYLPLKSRTVDLIVTSPPYASNAIDYMRAHKFSLAWMGHSIDVLGQKRGEYIGGETTTAFAFEELPPATVQIVQEIHRSSPRKGLVLHRYYSEMARVLREMFRVLKPGRAAIVVVGSSIMKGRDTETQNCLAEIGRAAGFEVPKVGVRLLDRNRRMMPAGFDIDLNSQIQQRMHEEYVIGFYKPAYSQITCSMNLCIPS